MPADVSWIETRRFLSMDCRVKPGNDDLKYSTLNASQPPP
jgi:hypothetical protein